MGKGLVETRKEMCGLFTNKLQVESGTCGLTSYFTTACFLLRDLTERKHRIKLKHRAGQQVTELLKYKLIAKLLLELPCTSF